MSGPIKRFEFYQEYGNGVIEEEAEGDYVLHADHLATHQYYEAVERAAFEPRMMAKGYNAQQFD